ncbi:MAG: hypothetical protein AAGJ46_13155 [Planctomycetota bacterium]
MAARLVRVAFVLLAYASLAGGQEPLPAEQRAMMAQLRLEEIDAMEPVALSDAEAIDRVVEQMPMASEGEVDASLTRQGASPDEVERSLRRAFRALLKAYAANTGDAVVDLMNSYGEEPSEEALAVLKEQLGGAADGLDAQKVVAEAWKAMGCQANWKSMLRRSTQGTITHCATPEDLAGLRPHTIDRDLFSNVTSYRHCFSGSPGFAEVFQQGGGLIVADVQWAIEHAAEDQSKEDQSKRTPPKRALYYAGFWWDAANKRWRPRELRYIGVGDAAKRPAPRLLF